MHTYMKSEENLWTVGYWAPERKGDYVKWCALLDFSTESAAQAWTSYLNGGSKP